MGVTIVDTQDTAKIKKMKNFHPTGNCPIRDILCRLGDKWSMLVLFQEQSMQKFRPASNTNLRKPEKHSYLISRALSVGHWSI